MPCPKKCSFGIWGRWVGQGRVSRWEFIGEWTDQNTARDLVNANAFPNCNSFVILPGSERPVREVRQ